MLQHRLKVESASKPLPQKQPVQLGRAIRNDFILSLSLSLVAHHDPARLYGGDERRAFDDKRRVVLKPKAKPSGPAHNPGGPRRPVSIIVVMVTVLYMFIIVCWFGCKEEGVRREG